MTTAIDHRLLEILRRAADGTPPEGSPGGVQVLSRPLGGPSAVLVLEGRGVVAADVAPSWVLDHLPPGFDGPDEHHPVLSPSFLGALGRRLGSLPAGVDLLLGAPGTAAGTAGRFVEIGEHPPAWSDHRADVRSYRYLGTEDSATLSVGRGPAGRWDVWVDPAGQPSARRGQVSELLDAVKVLVPPRSPVFTTVPVCSAAALALVVGIGFRPLGAEVLFPAPDLDPDPDDPDGAP